MHSNKTTARIVGTLFLVATVAYIVGSGLIESTLNTPDYLAHLYPNKNQVVTGVFFELLNVAAVVGIAVMLLLILRQQNEKIAFLYLGSRIIESVMLIVSVMAPLLLLTVSQEYIQAGPGEASYFQSLGSVTTGWYYLAFDLAMIVLGLGSLFFCYLLFTSKLVPRIISIIGFFGYAALFVWGSLQILGYNAGYTLFIPGALFEIIFPIWLIVKGFNPSATVSRSAR